MQNISATRAQKVAHEDVLISQDDVEYDNLSINGNINYFDIRVYSKFC